MDVLQMVLPSIATFLVGYLFRGNLQAKMMRTFTQFYTVMIV